MSDLQTYRSLEHEVVELQQKLTKLMGDERLKRELELVKEFNEMIEIMGFSLKDALRILNPDAPAQASVKVRKERQLQIYKNPFSGEQVQTKGGNNTILKAWKKQYGDDTVKAWRID